MAIKVLIGTPANGGGGSGDMTKAVYDQANVNEQLVGLTANQSLTNKSINGVTLVNTGSNNQFLDATGNYSSPSGSGDMTKNVYDPQNIDADAFDRANHTGTQSISTVTDLQTELDDKLKQGENILTEETTFELIGNSKKLEVTFDDRKLIFIVEDLSTGDYSEFFIDDSSLESVVSVGSDVNRLLLNDVITLYSEIQGKGVKLNDMSVDEANVDFLNDDNNLLTIG